MISNNTCHNNIIDAPDTYNVRIAVSGNNNRIKINKATTTQTTISLEIYGNDNLFSNETDIRCTDDHAILDINQNVLFVEI